MQTQALPPQSSEQSKEIRFAAVAAIGTFLLSGIVVSILAPQTATTTPAEHAKFPGPADFDPLVSPAGHVHVGTVLYLKGERFGVITGFEDKPSAFFADHRMIRIVYLDRQGQRSQIDSDSVLRLYQVHPYER